MSASKECVYVSSIVPYLTLEMKLMKSNFWYLYKSYKKAFLSTGNINDIFLKCLYPSILSVFKTKRYKFDKREKGNGKCQLVMKKSRSGSVYSVCHKSKR
jgi:hypothetical protein